MFSRAHRRGRMNYPCIPSRFPLSYLRRPSWKMPVATNTMSNVKPAIAASRGQVNWCSNCSGTKEMKPQSIVPVPPSYYSSMRGNSRGPGLTRVNGRLPQVPCRSHEVLSTDSRPNWPRMLLLAEGMYGARKMASRRVASAAV